MKLSSSASFLVGVERLVFLEFEGNFSGGDLLVDVSNGLQFIFKEISVVLIELTVEIKLKKGILVNQEFYATIFQ